MSILFLIPQFIDSVIEHRLRNIGQYNAWSRKHLGKNRAWAVLNVFSLSTFHAAPSFIHIVSDLFHLISHLIILSVFRDLVQPHQFCSLMKCWHRNVEVAHIARILLCNERIETYMWFNCKQFLRFSSMDGCCLLKFMIVRWDCAFAGWNVTKKGMKQVAQREIDFL